MRLKLSLISLFLITGLSGCTSITGLDSKSEFACNAPEGVSCTSVSGVYANAKAKNLPSQQEPSLYKKSKSTKSSKSTSEYISDEFGFESKEVEEQDYQALKNQAISPITGKPATVGAPLYQKPEILRVWFAPWEDGNQILHDQSFSYLVIQKGRWQIEHLQKQVNRQSSLSIITK